MTDNLLIISVSSINEKIIHISACIIDECILNCEYCYNKELRTFNILNLNKLLAYIEYRLMTDSNNILVSIIGGEPFLNILLYDFCYYFNTNKRVTIEILSNNLLPIDSIAKFFMLNNCMIVFSYHSINRHFNNLFLKNLDIFFKKYYNNKCNISISIMFEPWLTIANIKKIIKFIKTHDIYSVIEINIKLLRLVNYLNTQIIQYKLLLKSFNVENYILSFNNNTNIKVSEEYISLHGINNFYNWVCSVPKYGIYIHSNEYIYNCESYFIEKKLPIGNLNTFKLILHNNTICDCKLCFYDVGVPKFYIK